IQPQYIGGGVSLPVITAPVTIDGWSQGGAGYTGSPLLELDGQFADGAFSDPPEALGSVGFNNQASNVGGRRVAINSFHNIGGNGFGIGIFAGSNIWIYGNYIGTDPTGLIAKGNGQGGIWLGPGTSNDLIGTNRDGLNDVAERNLIAANFGDGIL